MRRLGDRQPSLRIALLLLGFVALLFFGCDDGPTNDQVKRRAVKVWAGSPAANPPLLDHGNWKDLNEGDAVKTDSSGEAELKLVNCTGEVYVFKGSSTIVTPCRKHDFDYASGQCLQAGFAWFNQVCKGRFLVETPGAIIKSQATAFSVGYLPEEQVTLVMVYDDEVTVQSVLDVDTDTLDEEEISVSAGQFLYTIPGRVSPEIAGVPARRPLPLDELAPLVDALPIQPWIEDVTLHAEKEISQPTEVPPTTAPPTEEVQPTKTVPVETVPPGVVPTALAVRRAGLRVGTSLEVETLDPYFVYQTPGLSVVHALFDHLIERDFDGNIVPGLAVAWEVVDAETLVFQLREGVTFHNGEPFNAESVVFSVERMLTEGESPKRDRFTAIDSVEAVDEYTVQFHLSRPDGTLFDSLTSQLAMLPPQYFEEVGSEGFAEAPVGTGPFTFVEWVPDEYILLVANPDYWEGSYKGRAEVETVLFRPIPEADDRVAEFRLGDLDIIQDVPLAQIDDLEAEGLGAVPYEAHWVQYIFFAVDDDSLPTYDVRVRQALNYAVNVEGIIEDLLGGLGSRAASPIAPGYLGYNPDLRPYSYDPAKALALLEEAGYPNGFETTLDVSAASHTDVVDAVTGYLSEVGIQVTILELEPAQFYQKLFNRTQSMLWAARWAADTPDSFGIETFASCDGSLSRYCNEEVNELLEVAADTLDQDERAAYYAAASQLMNEDPLAIYLNTGVQLYGVGAGVENFRPSPLLAIIVSGVSVWE